ncbi:hypothetical protein DB347_15575 [Opitutaceae bacterium EW11]|nr:hypothetical protein DB347_15575 [Opitutaceae bacterium EW11]
MPTSIDLKRLDRQAVLVRSSVDTHNPPTGVRGWIHVVDTGDATGEPKVEIVIEFPDMYNVPAHERIIRLREDQLEQLLASERAGWFELTLDGPLDDAVPGPRTNLEAR